MRRLAVLVAQALLLFAWLALAARYDGEPRNGTPYIVVVSLAFVCCFVLLDLPSRYLLAPLVLWLAVAVPLGFVVAD